VTQDTAPAESGLLVQRKAMSALVEFEKLAPFSEM